MKDFHTKQKERIDALEIKVQKLMLHMYLEEVHRTQHIGSLSSEEDSGSVSDESDKSEKKSKNIECPVCKKTVSRKQLKRHQKSKRCQSFLESE